MQTILKTSPAAALLLVLLSCCRMTAQPPAHCKQVLYCLFNQEAAASDPAGIHRYSEDLIGLIVENPAGNDSLRQFTNQLADRLSKAERAARADNGKLVPETAVVEAFNDLMQSIGAPPSMKTSKSAVHNFREHAASIKAFPALFTAARNGANCYPGEAAFLFYLLISDNGALSEQDLDLSVALMHTKSQGTESSSDFLTGRMEKSEPGASTLIFSYSEHHDSNATAALFNHAAGILGF